MHGVRMNTDQNNSQYRLSDEIDLRDLFIALWRQKLLIIIITVMGAFATGVISLSVLSPVYHAKLNIIINMPETHYTKYGDYTLPMSSNDQYINLITSNDIIRNVTDDMGYDSKSISIEALRDRISIVKVDANDIQNSFEIKVAADKPEEARRFARELYDNYIEFIDVMIAEGVVEHFRDYFDIQLGVLEVELESNKEFLEKNMALLAETPLTINQKEVLGEIIASDNSNDYIVMENIINPNYTALELDIISNKQELDSIENMIAKYNTYLDELDAKRLEIDKYYETGEFKELQNKIVRITKSNIYLPSEPVAPSNKTSPSTMKNIVIGGLLGAVVSVLIAFIKEFWFRQEDKTH